MPKTAKSDRFEVAAIMKWLSILCASILAMPSASGDDTGMNVHCSATRGTVLLDGAEWATFTLPELGGGLLPAVEQTGDGGWQRIRLSWDLPKSIAQDEAAVRFALAFEPDFWWAPHLSPNDGDCIAQHVFRSPALIAVREHDVFVVVPDLDLCGQNPSAPWFLDFDAPANTLWLGMGKTKITEHVHYVKAPGMNLGPGKVQLGFYVTAYRDENEPVNPWGRVAPMLWDRWAKPLYRRGEPARTPLDAYVKHTYRWALGAWRGAVWQEFELDGARVGAPAFIVNVTQSPNYPGEPSLREFLSIWNQAWFSSLRSASGLMRYAQRTDDADLRDAARMTKEFALKAPIRNGFFPAVYRTEMEESEVGGEKVARSRGWDTGYWTNSNRVPWERGVKDTWYHVLDASWTCLLMLRWHEDIESDARLDGYARQYAARLLTLQDERGFFPAWLEPETLEPAEVLRDSPETSMSATFLLKLAEVTGDNAYRAPALRALDAVLEHVAPAGRWEDYETYWSCCGWGKKEFLGKRIPRNAMYKQNTLSMFWTAEACLEAYRATKNPRYLAWGRRTLDELSMFQQIWQPPYIYVPALGGFGVMNFDGEWNDSRQTLFAELFMEYYKESGEPYLFERGVAALKAGFVMMYCPENPTVKTLWEKVWPFFGPEDYGFTMENYGHGGATSPGGEGMGNFTIYDWGNGAASEARNRIRDHFGDVYIDRPRLLGFGIDSIDVKPYEGGWLLVDLAGVPRDVRIVYEDGTAQTIRLDGKHEL